MKITPSVNTSIHNKKTPRFSANQGNALGNPLDAMYPKVPPHRPHDFGIIIRHVRRLWSSAGDNPVGNIYFAGRKKVVVYYDYVKSLFQ